MVGTTRVCHFRKFTIIVGHVCAIVNNFSTTSFITKDEEEEEFNELF